MTIYTSIQFLWKHILPPIRNKCRMIHFPKKPSRLFACQPALLSTPTLESSSSTRTARRACRGREDEKSPIPPPSTRIGERVAGSPTRAMEATARPRAAMALGHRLCLDPGLAEFVGHTRCGRGHGPAEHHWFRQREARAGCPSPIFLVAGARLPEQDPVCWATNKAPHCDFSDFRRV
jgi:hypothetical protein